MDENKRKKYINNRQRGTNQTLFSQYQTNYQYAHPLKLQINRFFQNIDHQYAKIYTTRKVTAKRSQ